MNKVDLKCCVCNLIFKRWPYELKSYKDLNLYKCKSCRTSIIETRTCEICNKIFNVNKKHKKITCSYACSNKKFRTGPNNGNWKNSAYRTTCFHFHKKTCIICGENKIVEAHHYDGDHKNNDPKNLVPLCPTHHQYVHSRFFIEIKDQIDKYYNNFKLGFA